MKTIKKINLFESIKELSIERYSTMNRILIQDVGFGSTFEDCKNRLSTLSYHITNKDFEKASLELANLQFGIFSSLEKADIKTRIFLCLCDTIDGEKVNNPEDEQECRYWFEKLESLGVTYGDVQSIFEDVKKKLILN